MECPQPFRLLQRCREDLHGPVLVVLATYGVGEIAWCSCRASDHFFAYDFASSTEQGYRAEKIAPVKRQNIDDGPVVPVIAPAVDVN